MTLGTWHVRSYGALVCSVHAGVVSTVGAKGFGV